MRITLMGNDERISAETALRIGLVSEITDNESLWQRADEIASVIAAKPTIATQGSVKAIWQSLDVGLSTAQERSIDYPLLGNTAVQSNRANMKKTKWTLR